MYYVYARMYQTLVSFSQLAGFIVQDSTHSAFNFNVFNNKF